MVGCGWSGSVAWAVRELGDEDAARSRGAASRYAHAVEVAARARVEWEGVERPFVFVQPNRAQGQHPLVVAMMAADRQAAAFAAGLGLTPLSAARLGPRRGRGRRVGAVSAPDRTAPPP
ncbi:MAG: P27 family phage terminase small subunit [Solirubrobacteraceae bacterium]